MIDTRWPDLPSDLLRDISGRLHDPVDFVCFHAVCKPWRDAAPQSPPAFLPLLLAPGGSWGSRSPDPLVKSIFSTTAWLACSVVPNLRHHHHLKWLARSDGTGTWLLSTTGIGPGDEAPCLVDPLTSAVTAWLPRFADEIACYVQGVPDGVVLGDGTIVLCVVDEFFKNDGPTLAAAVLRLGDAAWTAVLEPLVACVDFCFRSAPGQVDGEIVLVDFLDMCAIKLRVAGGMADVIQTRCDVDDPADDEGPPVWTPYSYIVESRGELLSVRVIHGDDGLGEYNWHTTGRSYTLSVTLHVHALDLSPDDGKGPHWARRDGRSLGDRVLFLGRPASFAVDASKFGGAIDGGCAYFVLNSGSPFWTEACLVYKYSFVDGRATVVAELPKGWETERSIMWFVPQIATIATTQEIRERLLHTPKINSAPPRSTILHAEKPPRRFGPYFKIYVGNLPWEVDNSRLRQSFNGHGQVADATVVYDRKTGRSRGFGFVTMASMKEPAVAVAALNGQVLDGRVLRVTFADDRQWKEPYMPLFLLPQQQPIYWWWWW
ncbi:hypothetical protein QOZ80_6BG0479360 [Eleusine coracana subsp. coracana]|nr:hypothetical protein QOZ80_6BG0479360 [Eleusine coracana subsp. coracana]